MVHFLGSIGAFGMILLFVALVVGLIFLFRKLTHHTPAVDSESAMHSVLEKKHPEADINQYSTLISRIGLVLSLLIVVSVFEFPSYDKASLIDLGTLDADFEEIQDVPPTEQKIPPPPKIRQPELVVVEDEEEIEQEIEIDLDVEIDEETVIEQVVESPINTEIEEEEVDEIFQVVEESAEPLGGYKAFYGRIKDELKYPRKATQLGVEGKVYVQFVVDRDGGITDVKAIRGIGAGCDEEAVRVVMLAGKWTPGKQRGRAVRQYMIIPITFKLN